MDSSSSSWYFTQAQIIEQGVVTMKYPYLFICSAVLFGCGEDLGSNLEDLPTVGDQQETIVEDIEFSGDESFDDQGILFTIDENGNIVQDLHRGVCFRAFWGPGKVKWDHWNPGKWGQSYSVQPEASQTLIWAAAPEQDIDAIYNTYWGCGTALKIPDSCTATVYTGGEISTCCNAAAAGKVPTWLNTYADPYFTDCPL